MRLSSPDATRYWLVTVAETTTYTFVQTARSGEEAASTFVGEDGHFITAAGVQMVARKTQSHVTDTVELLPTEDGHDAPR